MSEQERPFTTSIQLMPSIDKKLRKKAAEKKISSRNKLINKILVDYVEKEG
jgi:hypothetical protein